MKSSIYYERVESKVDNFIDTVDYFTAIDASNRSESVCISREINLIEKTWFERLHEEYWRIKIYKSNILRRECNVNIVYYPETKTYGFCFNIDGLINCRKCQGLVVDNVETLEECKNLIVDIGERICFYINVSFPSVLDFERSY